MLNKPRIPGAPPDRDSRIQLVPQAAVVKPNSLRQRRSQSARPNGLAERTVNRNIQDQPAPAIPSDDLIVYGANVAEKAGKEEANVAEKADKEECRSLLESLTSCVWELQNQD